MMNESQILKEHKIYKETQILQESKIYKETKTQITNEFQIVNEP